MAEIYRVMAGLAAPTGLPEDVFINTWHFSVAGADSPTTRADAFLALEAFYTEVAPHLPSAMTPLDYKLYMLSDAKPRPVELNTPAWVPSGGSGQLPWEVATCLSFYHDRNIPRQRGRVFIGPLTTAEVSQVGGIPKPNAIFRDALLDGAQAIWDYLDTQAEGVEWGLYSPTSGMIHTVDHAWVDDAFDTQRRRGNEPSSRVEIVRV